MATSSSTYSMPGVGAGLRLLVVDRPAGVGDVGLAAAELLEAVARPGPLDGHLQLATRELAGQLADSDRDRLDRRRAADEHVAGCQLDVAAGCGLRSPSGWFGCFRRRLGGFGGRLGGSGRGSVASAAGDVVSLAASSSSPQAARARQATIAVATSRLEEKFTLLAPFSRDMPDIWHCRP